MTRFYLSNTFISRFKSPLALSIFSGFIKLNFSIIYTYFNIKHNLICSRFIIRFYLNINIMCSILIIICPSSAKKWIFNVKFFWNHNTYFIN